MPSGKPGHGSKRPTDAQPQNEILRSWGLGGNPQQAAPEAEWLSRGIACYYYAELGTIIVIPRNELYRVCKKPPIYFNKMLPKNSV